MIVKKRYKGRAARFTPSSLLLEDGVRWGDFTMFIHVH